jgi:hypothetical protein
VPPKSQNRRRGHLILNPFVVLQGPAALSAVGAVVLVSIANAFSWVGGRRIRGHSLMKFGRPGTSVQDIRKANEAAFDREN